MKTNIKQIIVAIMVMAFSSTTFAQINIRLGSGATTDAVLQNGGNFSLSIYNGNVLATGNFECYVTKGITGPIPPSSFNMTLNGIGGTSNVLTTLYYPGGNLQAFRFLSGITGITIANLAWGANTIYAVNTASTYKDIVATKVIYVYPGSQTGPMNVTDVNTAWQLTYNINPVPSNYSNVGIGINLNSETLYTGAGFGASGDIVSNAKLTAVPTNIFAGMNFYPHFRPNWDAINTKYEWTVTAPANVPTAFVPTLTYNNIGGANKTLINGTATISNINPKYRMSAPITIRTYPQFTSVSNSTSVQTGYRNVYAEKTLNRIPEITANTALFDCNNPVLTADVTSNDLPPLTNTFSFQYTYEWFKNNISVQAPSATAKSFTTNGVGSYHCIVREFPWVNPIFSPTSLVTKQTNTLVVAQQFTANVNTNIGSAFAGNTTPLSLLNVGSYLMNVVTTGIVYRYKLKVKEHTGFCVQYESDWVTGVLPATSYNVFNFGATDGNLVTLSGSPYCLGNNSTVGGYDIQLILDNGCNNAIITKSIWVDVVNFNKTNFTTQTKTKALVTDFTVGGCLIPKNTFFKYGNYGACGTACNPTDGYKLNYTSLNEIGRNNCVFDFTTISSLATSWTADIKLIVYNPTTATWAQGGQTLTYANGSGLSTLALNGLGPDAAGDGYFFNNPPTNGTKFRIEVKVTPINNNASTNSVDFIINTVRLAKKDDEEDDFAGQLTNNVVTIYPNPVEDKAVVALEMIETGSVDLVIYDLYGKIVSEVYKHKKIERGIYSKSIETINWSKGVYFYTLSINGKKVSSNKIIK